ncbi:MAG: sugar ABC transporter permease [Clostridia bacterium]|nr:sugar ABC transporter permease [Clostridia bacterium]
MLLPAVVFILLFSYFPLYGVIIAFQKYNPTTSFSSTWIGFQNFATVFLLPGFTRAVVNTMFISFMKIVAGIVFPVMFALLLNEISIMWLKRSIQTLIYLPHFISWIILGGVFKEILSTDGGIVNTVLSRVGIRPVFFLGEKGVFPYTLLFTHVWKEFGYGTIVYLAALTNIDPGLYEAGMIDGAGRWRLTWHITLPGILSIITLMTVLSIGSVMNAGFDQVFNLYNTAVYETGDIIDTFVYRMGIEQAQYSTASAVGLFKSGVTAVLMILSYYLADRAAGYRVF